MAESGESRIALLRERVDAARVTADTATFPVPFRQRRVDLPKIQVPIDFPLYRVESGRTHRAQSQYIEQHGLDSAFFSDPESEEVQRAQYEILLELVDEENLRQDLLQKDQQDPVVLTYDGFIVDGNRRTAALRDEGEAEHLWAVVLDQAAEASDLYETELELQMARQTKAEYNWVDELLHIRLGVDKLYEGRSPDDVIHAIAQHMNRSDEEVRDGLGRLTLVDLYLEWLGQPGKYHRISTDGRGSAEQAFKDLYARLNRWRNLPELHKKAIREACFAVIEQSQGYETVRRVADTVRSRPADFVDGLRNELPTDLADRLDEPVGAERTDENGDADLLEELAGAEDPEGAPEGAELLNVTDAPSAKDVAPALVQVAEDLDEQRREAQQQLEPLKRVKRAATALEGVSLDPTTPRIPDIAEALDRVATETERLSRELDERQSER